MDYSLLKKIFLLAVVAFVFAACKSAAVATTEKTTTISYHLQPIDSRFDNQPDSATSAILAYYKPQMDALMNEVIGNSAEEMASPKGWDSPICHFTTKALLEIAESLQLNADFSLYNIGGIRTGMPKGDIRIYDIFSIFPFDNDITIISIEGKYIRQLIESFAQRKPEPMGNVNIIFSQGNLKSMSIGNNELDDAKIYRIVTNNFVAEGGDRMEVLRNAQSVERTGILIRDAMTDYIKKLTDEEKSIIATNNCQIVYE